jgi:hypothetical protein
MAHSLSSEALAEAILDIEVMDLASLRAEYRSLIAVRDDETVNADEAQLVTLLNTVVTHGLIAANPARQAVAA